MKVYIDILMTDVENATEPTTLIVHNGVAIKHIMSKPKIGLLDFIIMKRLFETCYKKLKNASKQDKRIQSSSKNGGQKVHAEGEVS